MLLLLLGDFCITCSIVCICLSTVFSGQPQLTEEEAEKALQSIAEHIRLEEERLEVRSADFMNAEDALQTSLNTLR